MQKQFLAIITACLVLTGCVKDTVELFMPEGTIGLAKGVTYKLAGECDKFCYRDWWPTATASDVQAELDAGAAVMGREKFDSSFWGTTGGATPLHYAAKRGTPSHIKMLVGAGAKINAKDVNNSTPLHYASKVANIKALLSAGADHDARDDEGGNTPLHIVAVLGNPASIQTLLTVGGLHTRNAFGQTPLNTVMSGGRNVPAKNMKVLVRAGADVNTIDGMCSMTPLHNAAEYGEPADVMFLLKAGANPNLKIKTPWVCGKMPTPIELASQNKRLKGTKAFYALRDATYK